MANDKTLNDETVQEAEEEDVDFVSLFISLHWKD
jgi:hypothetical protein